MWLFSRHDSVEAKGPTESVVEEYFFPDPEEAALRLQWSGEGGEDAEPEEGLPVGAWPALAPNAVAKPRPSGGTHAA